MTESLENAFGELPRWQVERQQEQQAAYDRMNSPEAKAWVERVDSDPLMMKVRLSVARPTPEDPEVVAKRHAAYNDALQQGSAWRNSHNRHQNEQRAEEERQVAAQKAYMARDAEFWQRVNEQMPPHRIG